MKGREREGTCLVQSGEQEAKGQRNNFLQALEECIERQ